MKKRKIAIHAGEAASPSAKRRKPGRPSNATKGTTETDGAHQQSGSGLRRDQSCDLEFILEVMHTPACWKAATDCKFRRRSRAIKLALSDALMTRKATFLVW